LPWWCGCLLKNKNDSAGNYGDGDGQGQRPTHGFANNGVVRVDEFFLSIR
jgi:hypothetical protein